MNTLLVVVLFLIGLILTIKGGDWFVDAAIWLAEVTGIPKMVIGATIVSFATTLPELLVTSIATFQGQYNMGIGNAVGSVNCNTGIIFGLSAVFLFGLVEMKSFKNKGILFVIACIVLTVLSTTGEEFELWEGLVMLVFLVLFLADSLRCGKEALKDNAAKEKPEKKELTKKIGMFILGAAAMAVGAKLMVDNGEKLAVILHVPDIIISITLVAIGTSLPELVTTITAIVKHQSEISVGNIVGANMMDMCFVLPVSSVIAAVKTGSPLQVDPAYLTLHMPYSILAAVLAVIPILIWKKTSRWQGILILGSYVAYVALSMGSIS